MRSFGRFRRASASSRPTSSVVAPASASIGPAASAPSLGPAPDSSSRPIIFAIWVIAVRGVILGFSCIGLADYGAARQRTAAAGGSAWLRSTADLYNRHRSAAARIGKLSGTAELEPREDSEVRHSKPMCVLAANALRRRN